MCTPLAEIDFGHVSHRHPFAAALAYTEVFGIPQQIVDDPIHIYRTV
jgi:hypothetical protein